MTYQIIAETDSRRFNMAVNNFLKDGWEFHGSTAVVVVDQKLTYVQAMTKQ